MSVRTPLARMTAFWLLIFWISPLIMTPGSPSARAADHRMDKQRAERSEQASNQSRGTEKRGTTTRPAENDGAVNQALTRLYRIPLPKQSRQPERSAVHSVNAYREGPYTDDAYADPRLPLEDRDTTEGLAPGRFGFVRTPQEADWASRALARSQNNLSTSSAYMSRGLAAFHAGQYRTAAKHFKLASETNQGDPSAMIYSAHALFAIGRYQESAAFLRKAFSLEPRIAMLIYDMRDDYRSKADFEEQLRALHNAIAASPRNMDRLTLLGYVLNFSDQPDEAFEVLSRARAINPGDKLAQRLYAGMQPPDAIEQAPGR